MASKIRPVAVAVAAPGSKDAPYDDSHGRDVVDHCANIRHDHTRQLAVPADMLSLRSAKRNPAAVPRSPVKPAKPTNGSATAHSEPAAQPPPPPPPTDQSTQRRKSSFPALEKLPLFQQFRKRGSSAPAIHSITPAVRKDRPPFVKSSSIARLFGNTYSTAAAKDSLDAAQTITTTTSTTTPPSTATNDKNHPPTIPPYKAPTPPTTERFHACANDDHDHLLDDAATVHRLYGDDFDVAVNPFRSLSRGLGRLFFKKSYSVKISDPDPEFKVAYLGNVLTGWAKGESCMEKPLATLWRNYTQNTKPDVSMRVKICPSGLKATTRQHGLTEYWSHRITFCSAPRNYPKVFCWIYRHEGRKLKHELRCHAVLCTKESVADSIAKMLQDNLSRALREFKRDKINKQNARLSLVNSVYENPSMPQRKIMLSVGGNNYRPPLERSKSAPRLMVIEETGEEPDEDDAEFGDDGGTTQAARGTQRPACCTVDPLYPAMTLGRRKCRRGHSIRRTGNRYQSDAAIANRSSVRVKVTPCAAAAAVAATAAAVVIERVRFSDEVTVMVRSGADQPTADDDVQDRLRDSGDDLDKLLLGSNYDTKSPLADELLSYFDMKFKTNHTSAGSMIDLHRQLDEEEDDDDDDDDGVVDLRLHSRRFEPVRTSLSLDNLDAYGDDDGDYGDEEEDDDIEPANGPRALYFSQADILTTLSRMSGSHHAHQDSGYAAGPAADNANNAAEQTEDDVVSSSSSSSASATKAANGRPATLMLHHLRTAPSSFDSDEGSISSGFETVSTVTTNGGTGAGADGRLTTADNKSDGDEPETAANSLECSSVRTTPLATCKQPLTAGRSFGQLQQRQQLHRRTGGDSFSDDSEQSDVSDESGYVEYQRQASAATATTETNMPALGAGAWNGSCTAPITIDVDARLA